VNAACTNILCCIKILFASNFFLKNNLEIASEKTRFPALRLAARGWNFEPPSSRLIHLASVVITEPDKCYVVKHMFDLNVFFLD